MTDPQRIADAVAQARALIAARGAEGRHHVAAAVLTDSGALHLSLSLENRAAWASICAEPGAVAAALTADPAARIVLAVAVNREGAVVAPCSRCRELLADHGPDAQVAVPGGSDYRLVTLQDLMPLAYKAAERFGGQEEG